MSSNNNEFVLKLMALLDKQKSKSQINTDIKEMEKVLRKVRLVATLTKGTTKTELNQMIKQLEAQLRQVKLQAKIDNRQLNREINNALRNVSARDIRLNINGNGERLNAQLRRLLSQAREFADRNPIRVNIDLKKEKLLNQLTTFVNKNTKINESAYWLGEAERLRTVISSVTNRDELRNATDQLQVFTTGVRATGYATVSTTDKIKGMLGNVIKIGNCFGLAFTAVNKFKQSLVSLKEMDTILTEISKTSEMTVRQLNELGDRSYAIASKYGVLANNFMSSFQEMSRAGFGEDKAQPLAELATLAQSAGALTSELANDYLIASNAAYGYSGNVERLNALLDAQNQVTNRNAVSMTELAEATKVAANQLANAAISEQEMTALLGTGIATTKESGQVVGRAVKAIVMNLQQVQNTDEGLETTAEDLGKVESCLDSLGIRMKETADGITRLRSPLAILSELAEVYNSLPEDSVERANIISDIGGKYRGNVLSSILSNWDTYIKMMGDYEDAAGSALREAEKTADSWEGRLAQLQNSWDSFVASLTDKDTIKGGISFLDGTIQGFEKLVDAVGALPVMLTTINASMAALNKNYGISQIWNKDTHRIDLQGSFMGIDISAYKTQIKHFREAEIAMASWNNSLVDGTADINTFNNATVQNNEQLKAYLQTTSVDAPASLNGYKAYLNAAGVSTDALRLKTVLLNTAISMGIGIAVQLAVKGVMVLAQKINDFAHASEKCKERVDEMMSSYQSALDKADDNAKTVESLASRYEELSKGVNNLGQNVSLAADEYSEYNDIVNQIAEMFPTMVQGYTNEGNAILSLKGNVEQLRDAYKEAQQEAYNMLIISGEDSDGNDIIKNYQNVLSNSNPFIKLNSSAKEYLEIIKTLHEAMLASEEEYDRMYNAMLGGGNKLTNDYNMSQAQLNEVKKTLKDIGFQADLTDEDKRNINASVKAYIQTYQAEVDLAMKNVQTLANAYLMINEDYAELDEQSKNAASIIVNSINENIASGFDDKIAVGEYVNEIVDTIKDNSEVQDALIGLFSLDITDMPVNEAKSLIETYIGYIAKEIGEDPLELEVRLGFDDTVDTAKRLQNSIRQLTDDHGITDREEYSYLMGEIDFQSFTQAQAEMWLEVTLGARNATEAVRMYEDALAKTPDAQVSLSISDTISQLNTQLKPTFDSLKSAYNDIFTSDGFALNSIDILSTCDSIKSKLDELNKVEGITVDFSSYEDLVRVLRDSESTEQDVETAFDSLATSITQAALTGKEDFSTMKAALEDLGVINNEIVAFDALISNTEALKEAGLDLADTTDEQITAFAEVMVSAENYNQAINLLRIQKILCNENPLSTAEDINELYRLAQAAGIATNAIQQLMGLDSAYEMAAESGNTIASTAVKVQMDMVRKQVVDQFARLKTDVDFGDIGGGASAAKSAGKDAGKSYADALKDKLSNLNSVISYIGDVIGDQIDLFEEQKDAAVEALEAEKEAAEEALDAEKELVQEKIDSKQAEIDAIEDAAKARKNELDLQKAQYDLERMQNQKTMLVNYMPDTIVI